MNDFDYEKIVTLKDLHTLTKMELEERLRQLINTKEYCKNKKQEWSEKIAVTSFVIKFVQDRLENGEYKK